MSKLTQAGILSIFTIFFWALLNVTLRYLVLEYNCHPIALACSNALFCSLALLVVSDRKINIKKIISNSNTWFFGLTQILKNICLIYTFVYISTTKTNLLTNIEIIFSVLLAFVVLKRKPTRIDIISMLFIFFGCLILIANLPIAIMLLVLFWICSGSILTSLRALFAEIHPENKKELSVRKRCGVTGFILLISSLCFICFFVLLSGITNILPESFVDSSIVLSKLPTLKQFVHIPSILGGLATGVIFYAISMYFYFYAISLSNSEYFMMYRSTQAVFTFVVESCFVAMALLPAINLSLTDWFASITIIMSSFSMIMIRFHYSSKGAKRKKSIKKLL